MPSEPTLLIISQVYVPDPTSLGQHMHDAAAELARRGFRVVVLTSRRGYEDPKQQYAKQEVIDGVEIRRLPWSNFGKSSIPLRLLGAVSFLFQAILRALLMRRLDGLLVSTSPPIGSLAGLAIAALRRAPIVYWVMDINPDQAVALGRFRADSLPVRWMDRLNRAILGRAQRIVTMDHFMAERLKLKQDCGSRLSVIPPWPSEDSFEPLEHEQNAFRREHGLENKFVAMYSGNMSIAHPLDTVLQAARELGHRDDVVFLFVGGGLGRLEVQRFIDEQQSANVRLLPYQPRERLRESLSAADVHLVSMGEAMVGIVHPCKIYGAMACGRPILLLGPRASHAGELVEQNDIGWRVDHGDVSEMVNIIETATAAGADHLKEMGIKARAAIGHSLSKAAMCGAMCDEVEAAMAQARFFGAPAETMETKAEVPAVAESLPVEEPVQETAEVGNRQA